MSKLYKEPELIVHKYNIGHNIFTDSGDKIDDDIYGPTNPSPLNPDMDVFGD